MLESWLPPLVALAYGGVLFLVAWQGDRRIMPAAVVPTPLIYSLALGIYCTSWTFFGAVGTAASSGWDYLAIYLGPMIAFGLLHRLPERIVAVSKANNVTSIADLLGARYGRSQWLAVLVSLVALVALLPYIALQLRAMERSYQIATDASPAGGEFTALAIAGVLAVFSILFGTRQVDVTESRRGLVLAVACESAVKLLAFAAVGAWALFGVLGGPSGLVERIASTPELSELYSWNSLDVSFIAHTVLAFLAILCLPRQFHVTVVENRSPRDLATARWAFPAYLAVFSIFIVPIAVAGHTMLGAQADADGYVLTLPLSQGQPALALLAFLGGFSAATAMVIVATIALATMLCNEVVMPSLVRLTKRGIPSDARLGVLLLRIRRVLVVGILALSWVAYQVLGSYGALASMGLLSFAAVAQFGPALIGGLYWQHANGTGALAGLATGFAVWLYTLLIPALAETGWLAVGVTDAGPFGIAWLSPYALFGLSGLEPITHGTFWSLFANVAVFVAVSLLTTPGILERRQAQDFTEDVGQDESEDEKDGPAPPPLKGSASIGDLAFLAERFVGRSKATAAFRDHFARQGLEPAPSMRADTAVIALTERLLSGAMGSAAARTLLASALRGGELQLEQVAHIVGETSQASRFNRDLLETTLENVPEGISVIDEDLRLVAWNRRYEELFDYPADLLQVGTAVEELIRYNARRGLCGPGDPEDLVERRLDHMRREEPHVFQRERDDGTVLELRQVHLPGGGFVTSFSDITVHKQVESALRESERAIRAYTDVVPVLIAFVDRERCFRFVNLAYEHYLGRAREQIIGRRVDEVLSTEHFAARKARIDAALAGVRQTFDVETSEPDGSRRHLEASYIPHRDDSGGVQGYFAVFHDVTERRHAESALKEAYDTLERRVDERTRELSELNERLLAENELRRSVEIELREAKAVAERANQGKTRFLAAASHDLMQPLNAARLFISALLQREPDERTAKSVQRIDASLSSAEEVLVTLLDISKLDAGALPPNVSTFALEDVLGELVAEFDVLARDGGIALRHVPCGLAVRSDRRFLRRIVQNLLSNALRYTSKGKVLLGCRRVGGSVRIEVWDTGPGIPADRLGEIFEEFRRLQRKDRMGEKGLGLGLAIAQRMANALGHRLDVRSWPGRGSVFSIDVPARAAMGMTRRPAPTALPKGGGLKGVVVLCVDNEADVVDSMAQLLEGWGCEVLKADSTAAALAAVENAPRTPAAMLVDYHLSEYDTGLATIAAIRAAWGPLPAVVITADHGDEVRESVRQAGVPIVRKPIRPAGLRAALNQLLSIARKAG
jgi:PAS domain S-box-containing protein